jgi:dCTP deaminase
MVLTGLEIIEQVKLGSIYIENFDSSKVNPNSYNLKLHNELLIYDSRYLDKTADGECYLDMKKKNATRSLIIPEDGFILRPGILYLGRTAEMTKTVGFVPQIQGRSSIGRLGIDVHKTAGWGDDGFENYWTLEIVATMSVKVYPFVDFCQIIYMKTFGDASLKYKGKYQRGHAEPIDSSKIYEEFQKPVSH